jgi:hypothetical protein
MVSHLTPLPCCVIITLPAAWTPAKHVMGLLQNSVQKHAPSSKIETPIIHAISAYVGDLHRGYYKYNKTREV